MLGDRPSHLILLDLPSALWRLVLIDKDYSRQQIAEEVLRRFLGCGGPLHQQPDLFARLAVLVKSVGRLHAACPEARLQPGFAAFPLANFLPPRCALGGLFGRDWPLPPTVQSTRRTPLLFRSQFAWPRGSLHTPVFDCTPTASCSLRLSDPSRKAVTSPYPASATTIRSAKFHPRTWSIISKAGSHF